MSYFQPEPDLTLYTKKDLLQALANEDQIFAGIPKISYCGEPKRNNYFSKNIKSIWLITLIDEIAKTQYPYNSTVQREAEKRLDIEKQSDSGSFLSSLVYTAQRYHESDNLKTNGFSPLTQEMIEQAFKLGGKIETHSEALFEIVVNGEKQEHKNTQYPVREHAGKIYAFVPRSRKKVLSVQGQPAKIVL